MARSRARSLSRTAGSCSTSTAHRGSFSRRSISGSPRASRGCSERPNSPCACRPHSRRWRWPRPVGYVVSRLATPRAARPYRRPSLSTALMQAVVGRLAIMDALLDLAVSLAILSWFGGAAYRRPALVVRWLDRGRPRHARERTGRAGGRAHGRRSVGALGSIRRATRAVARADRVARRHGRVRGYRLTVGARARARRGTRCLLAARRPLHGRPVSRNDRKSVRADLVLHPGRDPWLLPVVRISRTRIDRRDTRRVVRYERQASRGWRSYGR